MPTPWLWCFYSTTPISASTLTVILQTTRGTDPIAFEVSVDDEIVTVELGASEEGLVVAVTPHTPKLCTTYTRTRINNLVLDALESQGVSLDTLSTTCLADH